MQEVGIHGFALGIGQKQVKGRAGADELGTQVTDVDSHIRGHADAPVAFLDKALHFKAMFQCHGRVG